MDSLVQKEGWAVIVFCIPIPCGVGARKKGKRRESRHATCAGLRGKKKSRGRGARFLSSKPPEGGRGGTITTIFVVAKKGK